jgi:hypothetical protein
MARSCLVIRTYETSVEGELFSDTAVSVPVRGRKSRRSTARINIEVSAGSRPIQRLHGEQEVNELAVRRPRGLRSVGRCCNTKNNHWRRDSLHIGNNCASYDKTGFSLTSTISSGRDVGSLPDCAKDFTFGRCCTRHSARLAETVAIQLAV